MVEVNTNEVTFNVESDEVTASGKSWWTRMDHWKTCRNRKMKTVRPPGAVYLKSWKVRTMSIRDGVSFFVVK